MEDSNIQVGKYTLESLTTGMYSDPKIVYREYIQNSVDALENAVEEGLLEPQYMRIDIIIDDENSSISIKDNGTGIPSAQAVGTLMNVGNSQKRHSNNRGFRGIGRLGGMSYCDALIFSTSAYQEDIKTVVEFDCKKLRQYLIPGENEEMDLADVLNAVTKVRHEPEKADRHYFIVEMQGVNGFSDLLNIDVARNYISQVAPLPYKSNKFVYSTDLHQYLKTHGYSLEEFPIFVGESTESLDPVYKPVRHRFHGDRRKERNDEILSMRYFDVEIDGVLYALGWYAVCNWFGTLSEAEIQGIRVRKGNILIGDQRTLNTIFRQPRFNGWTQGELFIVTDKLIPNARRDDFEQNEAYFKLISYLQDTIGVEISRAIQEASNSRNDPSEKIFVEIQQQIGEATAAIAGGFNSSHDKDKLLDELEKAEKNLKKTRVKNAQSDKKTELQEKLTDAIEKVSDSSNYKINKVNSSFGKGSKKILIIISNILSEKLAKPLVDEIIDEIVTALNKK